MNRILWPLGILLLVCSLLGAGWALQHSREPDEVAMEPITEVDCYAMIDVDHGIANLLPRQMGEVVWLASTQVKDKAGAEQPRLFKKGEVLLRLRSDVAELQLGKAKAALAAAKTDLATANLAEATKRVKIQIQSAAIAAAKAEVTRLEADLEIKKTSAREAIGELPKTTLRMTQAAVDEAKQRVAIEEGKLAAIQLLEPQLDVQRAQANLDAKELDVQLAQQNLQDHTIVAPFDGTVLRWKTRVGELAAPNPQMPAVEFCPNTPRIALAEIVQEWGSRVRVGQQATVIDDVYQGPEWQGRVQRVSSWYAPKRIRIIEPFMTNDVRTLECVIEFTGKHPPVSIGQRVRVRIKV